MPQAFKDQKTLFAILVIGLALRLGWGYFLSARPEKIDLPDETEYLQLANNLLHGQGLKLHDPRFGQDVFAFRTPGYPVFLAACGGNVPVSRAAQAVLDTSTILAVYLLSRRWLAQRWALLAAALVAFNPYLVFFSGRLLSETLFTSLLAWGMYALTSPSPWLGSLLLALSILVRPSMLLLAPLLAMAGPRPLRRAAVTCLMILLALLPWAYRNHRVLGRWIWTTTNDGISLYDGLHPGATGVSDQSFTRTMPELKTMGEIQRSAELSQRAWQFVVQHPGRTLALAFRKIARVWSPFPLSSQFGGWKYLLIGLFYSLPLDVLLLAAVWRGKLPGRILFFLLLPAVYFTMVHAIYVGSLRYRIPFEPLLAILAAAAFIPADPPQSLAVKSTR